MFTKSFIRFVFVKRHYLWSDSITFCLMDWNLGCHFEDNITVLGDLPQFHLYLNHLFFSGKTTCKTCMFLDPNWLLAHGENHQFCWAPWIILFFFFRKNNLHHLHLLMDPNWLLAHGKPINFVGPQGWCSTLKGEPKANPPRSLGGA